VARRIDLIPQQTFKLSNYTFLLCFDWFTHSTKSST
jgi:hypothetical protein